MGFPAPIKRSTLAIASTLALASLTPAVAQDSKAGADNATPTTSNRRHSPNDHVKDLRGLVVTASPLRDTSADLSKPVDVLAGERLDESRAATLGEAISSMPGVQSSNFGPGVGRPVIRGQDGPRVAILTDGMVTQDVSTVSQDHSPTLEPFLADQIEILKGPSTLLYGSGAIGGAINVVDGRIPEHAKEAGFSGRAELRYDSVSHGNTDAMRVDGGTDRFALHADAVYRNNKDYDTPDGKQANSFIKTKTGSVGGSLVGDWGFVGVSAARFDDDYGNPGEAGVFLQLRQHRYDLKGGLSNPWGDGSSLRYSFGHTRYQHTEISGTTPGTTFTKNAHEGRIEASYAVGDGWQGAVGAQGSNSTFAAIGEESFVPRTHSREGGIFGIARKSWDSFQLDLGARVDKVKRDPEGGDSASFTPISLSLAGGFQLGGQWKLTTNLDHAERAPAEEELFAKGPHLATLAYESGNIGLNKEAANQLEVGLQYTAPWVDAKASVYHNKFKDFIYLLDTGDTFDFDGEPLPIRQWSQSNATFRGLEGEATFHLANNNRDAWDLRAFGDTVRATLDNSGGKVPRIVPSRLGAQLRWKSMSGGWRASLGATHVARQSAVATNETPTAGYTLVDVHATRHFNRHNVGWELFLDGRNLTNQVARVHTSFLKDDVVLPGRSLSAGVRVFF
jgi:iron complex outermembrane receptor protein